MKQIPAIRLADAQQFAWMRALFEAENSNLRLTLAEVDGAAELRTEHNGMRVFWIFQGQGEVFLPKGYRTQEGDGAPLPPEYRPEPANPSFAELLGVIRQGEQLIAPAAATAIAAILRRWNSGIFVGDYAGELWKLDHIPQPWTSDTNLLQALRRLYQCYRETGFSTKQVDSYEPVLVGDQLIVTGSETVKVRGRFTCLAMENTRREHSHVSTMRRLRYLADTAGGCNPDFAPFRRLPLTWFYNYPEESGDSLNWVNSHVVNIPRETSPTHFHPSKAVGGGSGIPQREMYLVLDPKDYRLNTWGRTASLLIFPNLRDLTCCQQIPLEPGMFIYIPPGTGHRGLDSFVNVLTIPGFKPHNEYYIDRDIRDTTDGKVPFNENLLGSKNYENIEDLLA